MCDKSAILTLNLLFEQIKAVSTSERLMTVNLYFSLQKEPFHLKRISGDIPLLPLAYKPAWLGGRSLPFTFLQSRRSLVATLQNLTRK
jgi:hypothetical protein